MKHVLIILLSLLAGCEPPAPSSYEPQTLISPLVRGPMVGRRGTGASCPTASQRWEMRVIHDGPNGADGADCRDVNGDTRKDCVTPWEEDDKITLSRHPGFWNWAMGAPWVTTDVMTAFSAPEDAKLYDLDGDGEDDVIGASEGSGGSLRIARGPTFATQVTIDTGRDWIITAFGDMNGDGNPDIVAGSKTDPVAEIGILFAPADPWVGSWTYQQVSEGSWVLSVHVGDFGGGPALDIASADRECYNPGSGNICDLVGTKWHENTAGDGTTWALRTIRNTGVGQSRLMAIEDMDGDGDKDVAHCAATPGPTNVIYISRNDSGDPWSESTVWTTVPITAPAGFGQCYALTAHDFDGDGVMDLAASADDSTEGVSTRSGVILLRGLPGLTFERWEVSGPTRGSATGDKFDNIVVDDVDHNGKPDIITTEQADDLGVVAFLNHLCTP